MKRQSAVRLSVSAPLQPVDACPECGYILPRRRRAETWVEEPIAGGWIGAYRLMVKAGRPLVAEVRLFPEDRPESRGGGQWSEEVSAVPSEGVPGRALHALRLKTPLERFPRFLRSIKRDPAFAKQLLRGHGIPLRSEMRRRRPGRRGRTDSYYLPWAVAYVERLAVGSRRPVKDLTESPPRAIRGYVSDGGVTSEATVRDYIHQARKRGLLSSSPSGRPGGELTPKAEQMLKRAVGKGRGRR
jgi:hypothetical protein